MTKTYALLNLLSPSLETVPREGVWLHLFDSVSPTVLAWQVPTQKALLSTLVHGLLLFATIHGTGLGDSGKLLWTSQVRELTGLGEKVIEGVTEVGNVMLI